MTHINKTSKKWKCEGLTVR